MLSILHLRSFGKLIILQPRKDFPIQVSPSSINPNRNSLHHLVARNLTMHLMYTKDEDGKRKYTLKKVVDGQVTKSAHPARFSPDDKWSRHRVTLKKRYSLLLTQQSEWPFSFCIRRVEEAEEETER